MVFLCLLWVSPGLAAEDRFDLLQTETRVYTNVTVTTKATNYIFIVHAGGMANIKVSDLPPETREKLGYAVPKKAAAAAAAWTERISGIKPVQAKQLEDIGRARVQAAITWAKSLSSTVKVTACGIALFIYLQFCHCCALICRKTGNPPGLLILIPLLQLLPLLRAAGMPPLWFLAFFVPVLNLVAGVVWSVKIAKARKKSGWVAFFLLLPIINVLAFLYLALSGSSSDEETRRRPQIVVLGAGAG